jgi:hypothetical protein
VEDINIFEQIVGQLAANKNIIFFFQSFEQHPVRGWWKREPRRLLSVNVAHE